MLVTALVVSEARSVLFFPGRSVPWLVDVGGERPSLFHPHPATSAIDALLKETMDEGHGSNTVSPP